MFSPFRLTNQSTLSPPPLSPPFFLYLFSPSFFPLLPCFPCFLNFPQQWFTVKLVETRRSAEQHELHSLRQYVNTLNACKWAIEWVCVYEVHAPLPFACRRYKAYIQTHTHTLTTRRWWCELSDNIAATAVAATHSLSLSVRHSADCSLSISIWLFAFLSPFSCLSAPVAIIGGRARARVNEMVMMVISSCKANQWLGSD